MIRARSLFHVSLVLKNRCSCTSEISWVRDITFHSMIVSSYIISITIWSIPRYEIHSNLRVSTSRYFTDRASPRAIGWYDNHLCAILRGEHEHRKAKKTNRARIPEVKNAKIRTSLATVWCIVTLWKCTPFQLWTACEKYYSHLFRCTRSRLVDAASFCLKHMYAFAYIPACVARIKERIGWGWGCLPFRMAPLIMTGSRRTPWYQNGTRGRESNVPSMDGKRNS